MVPYIGPVHAHDPGVQIVPEFFMLRLIELGEAFRRGAIESLEPIQEMISER